MRPALACLLLWFLVWPVPARAEPWFGWGDAALEDSFADGDLDEDDIVAAPAAARAAPGDVHGETWVSLVGFGRQLVGGQRDVGAGVVVGLALDRIAAGPVHAIAGPATPLASPLSRARLALSHARECVAAAWRASRLGEDDARIDAIASRSRSSAALPETRVRALRLWTDAAHATTLATADGTTYYDASGANLALEVRLTWRLDRLLFAGDEPTLERLRLEREGARARVAARTLEALFAWERAAVDANDAPTGSREESEAMLRAAESAATLDVLTGGWFSASGLGEAGPAAGPP
jgi:hypothetical protein